MKIYFTASFDVSAKVKRFYREIISILEKNGNNVVETIFKQFPNEKLSKGDIFETTHQEVIKNINDADVVITDISYPSGGVGYQIYHAFYQKKPIIILYLDNKSSNPSMVIRGIKSHRVFVFKYSNLNDLKIHLPKLLLQTARQQKIRFNLVVNNQNYSFIESQASKMNISKTRFINKIISDCRKANSKIE